VTRTLLLAGLLAWSAASQAADFAIVPDPTLTPGAVRTTDAGDICMRGTRSLRHWSRANDDHILIEYRLPVGPHPDLESDHLVPLAIGGADDDRNLWPEPRRSVEPVWNAERKDQLEWRLRELVCSGALDVAEAQWAIAEDWTEAYKRYVLARKDQSGGNTWPSSGGSTRSCRVEVRKGRQKLP
jgi:hypothetical protein